MKRIIYLSLALLISMPGSVRSQIKLQLFSTGYTAPVDIKNCGDDRLFIVEQNGRIQICDTSGVKNTTPFLDIVSRVQYGGEQGLLGLAFPSDYKSSGYFYVYYISNVDASIHISRFHVDPLTPDSADPNSEELILRIYHPFSNHNGGHLAFGPDGYLYMGTGDGGSAGDPGNRAQNPDSLLGKLLRIAVGPSIHPYNIPPTNPFAHDTTLGRPEIWSLGMRNPWRWSFDQMNGDLWIGDVGQGVIEEVDMQPAGSPGGLNYGWRCYEANAPYNTSVGCLPYSSYTPPVHQYSHTGGYCSITGGYMYRGARYQEMYAKYFYSDYCKSQVQYLEADSLGGYSNTNLDTLGALSITTFGLDNHGELYCNGSGGKIFRFYSLLCTPVATINDGKDTITDCGAGFLNLHLPFDSGYVYIWENNGTTVSNLNFYVATQPGKYIVTVDKHGCANSDSVYVDFVTPLAINFTGLDSIYCIYSSPDTLTPSINGGSFTGDGITGASFDPAAAGIGTHSITYKYRDSTGCSYSHSQMVHVDACLNVPENVWTNSISVYPNPSNGDFHVRAFSSKERKVKIDIADIAGRILSAETYVLGTGENIIPINVNISKGVYIIKFSDALSSSSKKIILQ